MILRQALLDDLKRALSPPCLKVLPALSLYSPIVGAAKVFGNRPRFLLMEGIASTYYRLNLNVRIVDEIDGADGAVLVSQNGLSYHRGV